MTRHLRTGLAAATCVAATIVLSPAVPASAAPTTAVMSRDAALSFNTTVKAAPAEFSGMMIDEATRTATVWYPADAGPAAAQRRLTSAAAAPAARVTAAAAARDGWTVKLVPAKRSLADLTMVKNRITTDRSWLPAGAKLSGWGVDVPTNTVVVSLTEVTPAATAAAKRAFGDTVRLEAEARAVPTSRKDDWVPFAGGIEIWTMLGKRCTTGFAIERIANPSDQPRMVTAGHCMRRIGDPTTNDFEVVGNVGGMAVDIDSDVAYIIESDYAPWMYFGGPDSTVGRHVRGAADVVIGDVVCTSGNVTGQNCNAAVRRTDTCVEFEPPGKPSYTVCNLDHLGSTNNSRLSQVGDSGGPVAKMVGTDGALVLGTIIGANASGRTTFFHPHTHTVPPGWRVRAA